MIEEERAAIIRHLSECPVEELREILFAIFRTRIPNPEEENEFHKNCFFLGTASSLLENDEGPEHWSKYEIEALAYLDRDVYGEDTLGADWGFCQFGTCQGCGVAVRSNMKHGICPICKSKVYMS